MEQWKQFFTGTMEMERKIVLDGNNVLSVAEFLQMPELRDNPIVQRVVQVRFIFTIYIYKRKDCELVQR